MPESIGIRVGRNIIGLRVAENRLVVGVTRGERNVLSIPSPIVCPDPMSFTIALIVVGALETIIRLGPPLPVSIILGAVLTPVSSLLTLNFSSVVTALLEVVVTSLECRPIRVSLAVKLNIFVMQRVIHLLRSRFVIRLGSRFRLCSRLVRRSLTMHR